MQGDDVKDAIEVFPSQPGRDSPSQDFLGAIVMELLLELHFPDLKVRFVRPYCPARQAPRHFHHVFLRVTPVHAERMQALERDLPLPDGESDVLNELLRAGPEDFESSAEARAARARLVNLAALCLGLTTFLGGIGLTIGLALQADLDIAGMFGIGLLPTFIGIGLLIFVRMTKQIEQNTVQSEESA